MCNSKTASRVVALKKMILVVNKKKEGCRPPLNDFTRSHCFSHVGLVDYLRLEPIMEGRSGRRFLFGTASDCGPLFLFTP